MPFKETYKTTIAEGESLSEAVHIGPSSYLVGIVTPAGWDAAKITFEASDDGETYSIVKDSSGSELEIGSITGAASIGLLDAAQRALDHAIYLKVRSGTSGSAVAQGDEVSLDLIVESYGVGL